MRDLLAAPDQFDWLTTRLEIARKLRNDPAFHSGWAERSAELSDATTARLRRQKQAGRLREDVPADVLQTYSIWCSTDWSRGSRPVTSPKGSALCWISSRRRSGSSKSVPPTVIGPAATTHGGAGLPKHAVDRPVRLARTCHQSPYARSLFVGSTQFVEQVVPGLVQFPHVHLPIRRCTFGYPTAGGFNHDRSLFRPTR